MTRKFSFRVCAIAYAMLLSGAVFGVELGPNERLITILQTNDIHGQVEPQYIKSEDQLTGGFAQFIGIVNAIRRGLKAKYGSDRAGVLLLDGGDQFQGTLMSNYNEGELVFKLMNLARYDAVVPGNHNYDFGPHGWLDDRVNPNNPDKNPRGVLESLTKLARFPLLAANVYYKDSVQTDKNGKPQWGKARRLELVEPYVIKKVAGVRVALIGLDHSLTPRMTTPENVSDLVFRDEYETYLEIREELQGLADVFVLILHKGNVGSSSSVSELVEKLTDNGNSWKKKAASLGLSSASIPTSDSVIDTVIAGHTHVFNNVRVNGVPIVQSGANGGYFGRIDLVWDFTKGKLNRRKTFSFSKIGTFSEDCTSGSKDFCEVIETGSGKKELRYEGVVARPSPTGEKLISEARASVAHLADRYLGYADGEIWNHRVWESPLSNLMTDVLRDLSRADIAFMNTGGLRQPIDRGEVTYEDLFRVLPFGNHGVVLGPMAVTDLLGLLQRSVQSCGAYSVLMQSGLKVLFYQDCKNSFQSQLDTSAEVRVIETVSGELIYDKYKGGLQVPENRTFNVATLDFLKDGGSGYDGFKPVPLIRDLGIVREAIANHFMKAPGTFTTERDRRWLAISPQSQGPEKTRVEKIEDHSEAHTHTLECGQYP